MPKHSGMLRLTALLFTLVAACNQPDKTSEATTTKDSSDREQSSKIDTAEQKTTSPALANPGDLGFLKEMDGKYPGEVKLLDNPVLKNRLEKLLGNRYPFFKETWAVESPMQVINDRFIAEACQAHNCGSTNFIIVADLSHNLVYAGIREEGQVKKYSEDGSASVEINKWAEGD